MNRKNIFISKKVAPPIPIGRTTFRSQYLS